MLGFKNITHYDNTGISNLIEVNLKEFLIDGFLRIGAIIPQRTSILRPDQGDGTINWNIWNADAQSWAYKRINHDGSIILTPAEIRVNGVVEPNVIINYARGQVTFDRELFENDIVEARHYTNRIGIFNSLELNRRPMIQLGSDAPFSKIDRDYSAFRELAVSETVQTPCIILETYPTGSADPVMLGSGRVWMNNRVQMYVMTGNIGELSRILNVLSAQSYRTIDVFDVNTASIDGVLPIDVITGDINISPNAVQYPDLVQKYFISSMYWQKISTQKSKSDKEDIQIGMASMNVEIMSNPRI